jgi:hypothetical protein
VTSDGRVGIGRNAAAAKSGNASTAQVLDRFSEGYSIGQASSLGRSTAVMLDAALRVVERSPWISAVDTTSLGEWIGRSPDAAQEPQPDRTPEPASQAPEAAPSAITSPASVTPSTALPDPSVPRTPTAGAAATTDSAAGREPASQPSDITSPRPALEPTSDADAGPAPGPSDPIGSPSEPSQPAGSRSDPSIDAPIGADDDRSGGDGSQEAGALGRLSAWLSRDDAWWSRWWFSRHGEMIKSREMSLKLTVPVEGGRSSGEVGPVKRAVVGDESNRA